MLFIYSPAARTLRYRSLIPFAFFFCKMRLLSEIARKELYSGVYIVT